MNLKSVIIISILICGLLIGPVSAAAGDTILFEQVNISSNITQIWNNGSFQVYPVVQGVTSTDNIDQSLDSGWAAANTYALGTSVSESATNIQTFTPTKSKITNISIYITATGTGLTWYLVVHDASNNVLASNSFTPVAGVNSVSVPTLWTSGKLHFHVYASATTGTPTLKAGTTNDLETGSYIQYYAKNTEAVNITVNGNTTMLDTSDATGLLSGATVDTHNGTYSYTGWGNVGSDFVGNVQKLSDIYQASFGSRSDAGYNIGINGWLAYLTTMQSNSGASNPQYITYKINTILPIKKINISVSIFDGSVTSKYVQVSPDNSEWTTLRTITSNTGRYVDTDASTTICNDQIVCYARFYLPSTTEFLSVRNISFYATLNTTTSNQTILSWQNGINTANITSYGNAVSSTLDPSLQANVSLIEGASLNSITADFTISNSSGIEPLLTHFTDTSTTNGAMIDAWFWDFGDGTTSTEQDPPDHTYPNGTYDVNLTITNTSLSLVSTKIQTVTVYKLPNVDFSSFNTQGTAPFTTYLYDTSTNLNPGPYTYFWDLGDGNTSTSQNLYYTWNITGTYNVNHSVTDSVTTAWNNKTGFVTVGTAVDAPVASFYGGPQLGAPPLKVFFTDVSSNTPTGWFWEFGDGTNSTSQNPEHYFNRSGFYTVNLTAANTAGSNSTSQTNFVMVY